MIKIHKVKMEYQMPVNVIKDKAPWTLTSAAAVKWQKQ